MINKLFLKNFKCFTENNIDFSNLTVLTGTNSSGKSSIIQALLIILNSAQKHQLKRGNIIDLSDIFEQPIGGAANFKSNNPIGDDPYSFQISAICDDSKVDFQYKLDRNSMNNLVLYNTPSELKRDCCYLNAERIGPRLAYTAGGKKEMKSDGSNAVYIIDWMDNTEDFEIVENLNVPGANTFSDLVEAWMSVIFGEMHINVNTDVIKAQSEFKVKMGCSFEPVIPTMSGFGVSYVLPIITAGLLCSTQKNSILIIENPEAHLHPAAQSNMGKFLTLVAESGVQVVIETHSEHIIDGIRIQSAFDKFYNNVVVNFLEMQKEGVKINAININSSGELGKWPKGFFDQKQSDLRQLFNFRRKNDNK